MDLTLTNYIIDASDLLLAPTLSPVNLHYGGLFGTGILDFVVALALKLL
jgi:hypothetical protein